MPHPWGFYRAAASLKSKNASVKLAERAQSEISQKEVYTIIAICQD